jgi:hypothetical protein
MSTGRRGTSEEGKDGESAGEDRRREGFDHGDDGGGGRGSRCVDGMDGDVGGGAESAVGVCFVAVGVAVRNLDGAEDNDQKNAEEREEDSPGRIGARLSVVSTHQVHYNAGAVRLFEVRWNAVIWHKQPLGG